jgi:hypothetical protein
MWYLTDYCFIKQKKPEEKHTPYYTTSIDDGYVVIYQEQEFLPVYLFTVSRLCEIG